MLDVLPALSVWRARRLSEAINASGHKQQAPWISKDGKRLYFERAPLDESHVELLVAHRNANGAFEQVDALRLKADEKAFHEPSLTANEKTLFASVFTGAAGLQFWSGAKDSEGVYVMQPID